eukprot:7374269-Alexandrium_andersonii.AAC.1
MEVGSRARPSPKCRNMDRSTVGVVKAIAKDKVIAAWPGSAGQKDHAVGVLDLRVEDPAKEREERETEMERKRR